MRVTFLGTGTSHGVPAIQCDCSVCTSPDRRNERARCAVVVQEGGWTLLIDTPPELRQQAIRYHLCGVDAVLFTHAHADHVHGIDDLRAISMRRGTAGGGRLPVYGPPDALAELARRFNYIFDDAVRPPAGTTKPQLTALALAAGEEASVAGLPVLPLALPHGDLVVYGYRVGPIAYLTDAKSVPEAARARLAGVEVLVLNALLSRPHPLHLSIPEAVATAQAIGARRTLLTHLTHERRHADLAASLPPGIEPGYDGQVVDTADH
jgi:phosphoribosyl 1,2-cyclic phosphate phosphodiesterase